jgi:hypothetical protein
MAAIDVFISSTCYDLGDLRAELGEFLRGHAFLVRMSEDYESEFEVNGRVDSIESCLDNVRKADAVVCILDRRYGPVLPAAHKYAGVSARHAEILEADAVGKPIFNFVREATFIEADQITANAAFKPRWIDKTTKAELAKFVTERKTLATANKNNWVDQFKTSLDLRPRVLKRLLDHFPAHAGAYARRPDRLVRLYFSFRGNNAGGMTTGTFVNAGNGPAIDITCGWKTGKADTPWVTQGGLAVEDEVTDKKNGALAFPCPPGKADLWFYCEYGNASGDRFRVEAPTRWSAGGYLREGPEEFFVWIGAAGGWLRA